MDEQITFHFEGALADSHEMNFYEAARFQYAAARFIVKLIQFRDNGRFSQKITNNSNRDILLKTHSDGSFDITIFVPLIIAAKDAFIETSISQLMSYVFERIVGKFSDSEAALAINENKSLVSLLGQVDDNKTDLINKAFEIIEKDQGIKNNMHIEMKELYENG